MVFHRVPGCSAGFRVRPVLVALLGWAVTLAHFCHIPTIAGILQFRNILYENKLTGRSAGHYGHKLLVCFHIIISFVE